MFYAERYTRMLAGLQIVSCMHPGITGDLCILESRHPESYGICILEPQGIYAHPGTTGNIMKVVIGRAWRMKVLLCMITH